MERKHTSNSCFILFISAAENLLLDTKKCVRFLSARIVDIGKVSQNKLLLKPILCKFVQCLIEDGIWPFFRMFFLDVGRVGHVI
jgi:hypothetical protein